MRGGRSWNELPTRKKWKERKKSIFGDGGSLTSEMNMESSFCLVFTYFCINLVIRCRSGFSLVCFSDLRDNVWSRTLFGGVKFSLFTLVIKPGRLQF